MNAKPMKAGRAESQAEQTPQRKKFNAQRSALRALGETAIEGLDFAIDKVEGGYVWRKLEAAPAASANTRSAGVPPAPEAEAPAEPADKPDDPPAAVRLVALSRIYPSPLNPRRTFDPETVAELAEAIAEKGVLQNLVVREDASGGLELAAGERRWRALRLLAESGRWNAEAARVPALFVDTDDAGLIAIAIIENLQREAVNPMEEAEGMARLHRLNPDRWSTAEIARRIGKTPRHVQLRLALTDRLSENTRAALRDGRINLAQARALTGMPAAIQAKTVKAIAEGKNWTQRAEDMRVGIFADLVPASRAIFDPAAAGVEVIEDDAGERWLAKDDFLPAQKAAVEAKVAALAAEWAWAETKSYFYAGAYQDARTEDRSVGGAVVLMDWQGAVQIETGLQKFESRPLLDMSEEQAAFAADRAARREAMQDLQARLWDGLHGDETAALALCAFGLICLRAQYMPMRATQIGGDLDFTTPRLRETWSELVRFQTDESREDWEGEGEDNGLCFMPDDDRAGLFAELLSWPKSKLAKLIAAIAADSVVVDTSQSAPDPATAALLARFAVPLPDFWHSAADPRPAPGPEAGAPSEPAAPAEPATEESHP